ncbi:MAG: hypothetical protein QM831_08810 [Kofleriaceae bacterium]
MIDQPPSGLRIIDVTPVYSFAELDRCLMIVWRQQPTRDAFERRHQELEALAKRSPKSCAYVEVIESSSKPPTDELRKIAVQVFKKLGKDLSCVGFVIEGTDLRTTMVRAILTGMTFLVPQMQPSKVFKRLGDAGPWVRNFLGEDSGFDPRFAAAFDYLRKSVTPPVGIESHTSPVPPS